MLKDRMELAEMIRKILDRISGKNWCVFLGIICVIMIVFQLNISHMEQYKLVIANNIASLGDVTWGNSQSIRSDEWLGLSSIFHDMYLQNQGLEGVMEYIVYYSSPANWGFAFLPDAMAFSWYTVFPYFYGLVFSYLLCGILFPERRLFPIIISLILSFAPESIWWWGPGRFADAYAIVVCFYYFFHSEKWKRKVVCALGLAVFLPYFIIDVYPAWDVPLVYLSLVITVLVFIERREQLRWHKSDAIYVGAVVLWTACVLACYWITEGEALEAIANTVYPGARLDLGGELSIDYLYHYMMVLQTPFQEVLELNKSEVSSYIGLYPLPFLCFVFYYKDFIKNKLIVGMQVLATLLFLYAYVGFPQWLAYGTLMIYSTEERVFTIFGLVSVLIVMLQLDMIAKNKLYGQYGERRKKRVIIFNIVIVLYFVIGYLLQVTAVEYLGVATFCAMGMLVLGMGNLLILGKEKCFIIIFAILTFLSCYSIIPINHGIEIMTETSIAQEIQEINEEEQGNWITLEDFVLAKYVNAQGVDCINYLSYPPRMDLFELLDPEGNYMDVYNRYAHMIVYIVEESSYFELLQDDMIVIYVNEDDLRLWDVTYIVTTTPLNLETESYYTELLYEDTLDGILIYKVYDKE